MSYLRELDKRKRSLDTGRKGHMQKDITRNVKRQNEDKEIRAKILSIPVALS